MKTDLDKLPTGTATPIVKGDIFLSGGGEKVTPALIFEIERYLNSITCAVIYEKFNVGLRVHLG